MRLLPGALILLILTPALARAAAPPPLNSGNYQFPGAVSSPGSTTSASLGMSDAWLGDEPFENPAVPPQRGVWLTPMLYHISRQDLRAHNRSLSEQSAFFDGAGGWVGYHTGGWSLFGYAYQPVLRLEENSYLFGPVTVSPAPIENSVSTREFRGGAGVSRKLGPARLGAAVEYNYRADSYSTADKSGSPVSGTTDVSFSGSGVGGMVGLRVEAGPEKGAGHLTAGLAVRYLPELSLSGEQNTDLVTFTSHSSVDVKRQSGYESGLSLRYAATSQLRVVGGMGGRTSQDWKEFDVTRGEGFRWGVGLDFHDTRDPWTLRFGVGQESDPGSPEPRSGVVGLGIGWLIETTQLDFGVVQHTFSHLGSATCYDDRVMVTLGFPF
jgi:hypothetical protein